MSDNKASDTELTIQAMAKLSLFENKLNDIQLKNMKIFPLIFFNGVKSAEISYDFQNEKPTVSYENDNKNLEIKYEFQSKVHGGKVSYRLNVDETSENSDIDKRYLALESSVRRIFWKDTDIEVYFNEKLMYKSK